MKKFKKKVTKMDLLNEIAKKKKAKKKHRTSYFIDKSKTSI